MTVNELKNLFYGIDGNTELTMADGAPIKFAGLVGDRFVFSDEIQQTMSIEKAEYWCNLVNIHLFPSNDLELVFNIPEDDYDGEEVYQVQLIDSDGQIIAETGRHVDIEYVMDDTLELLEEKEIIPHSISTWEEVDKYIGQLTKEQPTTTRRR
jgi:hypothetical protein